MVTDFQKLSNFFKDCLSPVRPSSYTFKIWFQMLLEQIFHDKIIKQLLEIQNFNLSLKENNDITIIAIIVNILLNQYLLND